MKKIVLLLGILLMGAVLVGCAPKGAPVEKPAELATPVTKTGWEAEWERTLTLARKEGVVKIFTTISSEARIILSKAFKDKMGIYLEMIAGRPPELVERILAERRAGLFITDVYLTGAETAWKFLKPIGALESPEKYLLLPEVMDPKVWWGGKLLWMDKERTFLQFTLGPANSSYRNTDMVGPEEITSFKDLLAPKWKGKIILGDPLMGATMGATLHFVADDVMGWDFIRKLAKQEPVILRDERQMVEWVARGKYPVLLGASQRDFALELIRMGMPIAVILYKEGAYLTQAHGALTVLNRAPHPNATKIFINWLLTREEQTIFSQAIRYQSARLDVPTDHLEAWEIRQPGVPYVNTSTEEYLTKRYEKREDLAKILGIIK